MRPCCDYSRSRFMSSCLFCNTELRSVAEIAADDAFLVAFAADEARQDGLEATITAALAEPDCYVPLTVDGHNCARYGCR